MLYYDPHNCLLFLLCNLSPSLLQDDLLGFATQVPLHGDVCLSLQLADHRAEWEAAAATLTLHSAFLSPGLLRVTSAELDIHPHGCVHCAVLE